MVEEALHLIVKEVAFGLGPGWFLRKFLEENVWELEKEGKWEPFGVVLALIIYGLSMFPNDDEFIDPLLSVCSWRKIWFLQKYTSEVFLGGVPKEFEVVLKVITSCGEFPNVPLIGPRGYINYNLTLSLRQFRYPLEDEPKRESLKDFILPGMGMENPDLLRKIKKSWSQIHKKGKELGKRDCRAKEPYQQWVIKRVEEVKLPFSIKVLITPLKLDPTHFPKEKVDKLRDTIVWLTKENEELRFKLNIKTRENMRLKRNNEVDIELFVESKKKAKIAEDLKEKYQYGLARVDLGLSSL
ncbi:uncharacterized protein LOC127131465 [Lathyrus oleraceus]|uniref:uncharacterized protein LOC127131465 n=1 Tax=Pisum sativum TaxID=3888 RepID=UPI0021CFF0EC|nr:uncharacterized protein LOC127131465 [Pisum sativum]